ncbi:MAG: xanthine dehydrogenase family protein subunit M [Streptosporangiales bacterium]|nr:xanthine dehydrogenase family protein subunit M [Streptosporangiales bacterium]MBO0891401.1 xanthine dehydrogenase family protein subunit M [Acidothermales bacterium]
MTVATPAVGRTALHRPDTVEEVLDLLAEHGEDAKLIAGGTAFTILWRAGLISAGHLVGLSGVPGLDRIEADDDVVSLGALARLRSTEISATVRERLPVVAAALGHVGNLRVRNAATWGGNVAEADNTSDLPCLLAALDAEVRLRSRSGARSVPVDEFFVDYFETALAPDELVVDVRVPVPSEHCTGSYVKFLSRNAEDRTCLGVAAFLQRDDDGNCSAARVAAIGAGPVPLRVREAEQGLQGPVVSPDAMRDVAARYVAAADPLSDIRGSAEYRLRVLPELVVEALTRAWAGHDRAVLL